MYYLSNNVPIRDATFTNNIVSLTLNINIKTYFNYAN